MDELVVLALGLVAATYAMIGLLVAIVEHAEAGADAHDVERAAREAAWAASEPTSGPFDTVEELFEYLDGLPGTP